MKFTTAIFSSLLLATSALAQSQKPLAKLPPGCLLHAVNTQDEPSDLNAICGNNAKKVQSAIASLCQGSTASVAQDAFIATCSSAGKKVAAYTGSSGSKPTGTVVTTTDSQGRVVTQTSTPTGSANAAPMITQRASSGYVVAVVAVVAVAAL